MNKLIKKYIKITNDIVTYLTLFQGPLAPRGEGAKAAATEELEVLLNTQKQLMAEMKKRGYGLEVE